MNYEFRDFLITLLRLLSEKLPIFFFAGQSSRVRIETRNASPVPCKSIGFDSKKLRIHTLFMRIRALLYANFYVVPGDMIPEFCLILEIHDRPFAFLKLFPAPSRNFAPIAIGIRQPDCFYLPETFL